MKEHILTQLEKYMKIPSPGGYTHEALEVCEKDFKALGIETIYTKKGALIAKISGRDTAKTVVISAHMDTLGGMVKEILPSGRLRFHKIGGGVYNAIEGENCTVITASGNKIRGSVIPLRASSHLYGQEIAGELRNEHNMTIRLDEKVKSIEDVKKLGISVGDFIAMEPRLEVTPSGFIKSRYIDNKACVAVVMDLCKHLVEEELKPQYTTLFYMSNYEEMGHGLSDVFDDTVEEVVALDIGIVGEGQTSSEYKVSIAAKDAKTVYDYSLRQKLVNLCQAEEIEYAVDVYNRYSSDATQAIHAGRDFKFACIGPGTDASHHYERTHIEALENTWKLIKAYLRTEH